MLHVTRTKGEIMYKGMKKCNNPAATYKMFHATF
jgi:hypothetical protein